MWAKCGQVQLHQILHNLFWMVVMVDHLCPGILTGQTGFLVAAFPSLTEKVGIFGSHEQRRQQGLHHVCDWQCTVYQRGLHHCADLLSARSFSLLLILGISTVEESFYVWHHELIWSDVLQLDSYIVCIVLCQCSQWFYCYNNGIVSTVSCMQ